MLIFKKTLSNTLSTIRSALPLLTKGSILVMGAIVTATCGAFIAVTLPIPGTLAPREGQKLLGDLFKSGFRYQLKRPVNILVMGIDRTAEDKPEGVFEGNSDSLLLFRVDPQQRGINLLSIPRDTQISIPGIGIAKINEANPVGGPALVGQVITDNFDGVPIDRYVRFSTEAFRVLIDQVGGIEVNVPEDMDYEDKTQKLFIHLKKGVQILDGVNAEKFARFRHDNLGDIGRVQRQQLALKALRQKLSSPAIIPQLPGIVQVMQKYIDTNLTFEEISALLNYGLGVDQKAVKMVLLPGRFSDPEEFKASYWILDPDGRDRIMKEYFNMGVGGANVSTASLRIVIENASDDPEAGKILATKLEQAGYENVSVTDDRSEKQTQTEIIVQGGQDEAAKAVQQAIGIGILDTSSTGELESDITLRVGNDIERQKL